MHEAEVVLGSRQEPAMAVRTTLSPFDHHRRLVAAIRPRQAWAGQPLPAWRRRLRRTVAELTGYARIDAQERCPLAVRSLWRREVPEGVIEKIRFTVEPGCDAVAFVCVPQGAVGRLPWMICLQGHSSGAHNSIRVERDDNALPLAVEGDRDFAYSAMANGCAALCLEQRNFGERRHRPENKTDCFEASMQALHLGRTTLGERVYDVDRAIDYLLGRDDVDRRRIGVMGNSGGGTTSVFAAALLPRLACAMPSCYLCTFADSILAMHHCCCNFVPGLQLEAEMADVLGLFAPRPLVVVAGREDPIFPIAATRKAFKQVQAIYAAAGAADRVALVVGPEGHRFYAEPAWKAARRLFA